MSKKKLGRGLESLLGAAPAPLTPAGKRNRGEAGAQGGPAVDGARFGLAH